jgi:hypothetical protein
VEVVEVVGEVLVVVVEEEQVAEVVVVQVLV